VPRSSGDGDDLQVQARALGDPTRHELFRYAVDAARPVGVAELTDHVGLNHNAVRQHLAKLVDAGLLVEDVASPSGRGRPRLEYTVDPSVESRWGATGPYERLSLLLTDVIRSGDAPVEVGRRAGRRERLGSEVHTGQVDELVARMTRHGFEPDVVGHHGEAIEVVLGKCPFESAALADPDTVCQLHLGLAYGIADDLDGVEVEELVPHDPRHAGCRLRCRITDTHRS